jgi:hypothetical protein
MCLTSSDPKRIERDGTVSLPKTLIRKIGAHEAMAQLALNSINDGLVVSEMLNTSFVTDRSLDIEFLNSLGDSESALKRNQIVREHLTTIIPFLADVSTKDLLKLRKREAGSFLTYRQSLLDAITEVQKEGEGLTKVLAEQVYGDIVRPKLAMLDASISEAKRDLIRIPLRNAIAMGIALTFGFYVGLLPSNYIELGKAISGIKVMHDAVKEAIALTDTTKSSRSDDMYFLWKVRQKAKTVSL